MSLAPYVRIVARGKGRARAMTLAPRSWPSRPGLATRTRKMRLAIWHYLLAVSWSTSSTRTPLVERGWMKAMDPDRPSLGAVSISWTPDS